MDPLISSSSSPSTAPTPTPASNSRPFGRPPKRPSPAANQPSPEEPWDQQAAIDAYNAVNLERYNNLFAARYGPNGERLLSGYDERLVRDGYHPHYPHLQSGPSRPPIGMISNPRSTYRPPPLPPAQYIPSQTAPTAPAFRPFLPQYRPRPVPPTSAFTIPNLPLNHSYPHAQIPPTPPTVTGWSNSPAHGSTITNNQSEVQPPHDSQPNPTPLTPRSNFNDGGMERTTSVFSSASVPELSRDPSSHGESPLQPSTGGNSADSSAEAIIVEHHQQPIPGDAGVIEDGDDEMIGNGDGIRSMIHTSPETPYSRTPLRPTLMINGDGGLNVPIAQVCQAAEYSSNPARIKVEINGGKRQADSLVILNPEGRFPLKPYYNATATSFTSLLPPSTANSGTDMEYLVFSPLPPTNPVASPKHHNATLDISPPVPGRALLAMQHFADTLTRLKGGTLDEYTGFVEDYFTDNARFQLVLTKASEDGMKVLDVGATSLPRFFSTFEPCGIAKQYLRLPLAVETNSQQSSLTNDVSSTIPAALANPKHVTVKCDEVEWELNRIDRSRVYLRGSLVASWTLNLTGNHAVPGKPEWREMKMDRLELVVEASEDERSREDAGQEDKFGIPAGALRVLEIAEQMENIHSVMKIAASKSIAPREALNSVTIPLVKEIADSKPPNRESNSNPNSWKIGTKRPLSPVEELTTSTPANRRRINSASPIDNLNPINGESEKNDLDAQEDINVDVSGGDNEKEHGIENGHGVNGFWGSKENDAKENEVGVTDGVEKL